MQKQILELMAFVGMCKARIETTTIKLKGVKVSKWDMSTKPA